MIGSTAVLAGSPGIGEIVLIFAVALLLFGPHQLPSIARSLGRTLERFRRATADFVREITMESGDDERHSSCDPPSPAPDERRG